MQEPGWAALLEIKEVQTRIRRGNHLLSPLQDANKLPMQQFELGEAAGMDAIMKLPYDLIEDYKQQVHEELTETEEEDDNG